MALFNPIKYDPAWDIDANYESAFLMRGCRILVRHLGNRKFEVAQDYKPDGKNLYVAWVESYTLLAQKYTLKTVNCGEIIFPKEHYLHFVFVPQDIDPLTEKAV